MIARHDLGFHVLMSGIDALIPSQVVPLCFNDLGGEVCHQLTPSLCGRGPLTYSSPRAKILPKTSISPSSSSSTIILSNITIIINMRMFFLYFLLQPSLLRNQLPLQGPSPLEFSIMGGPPSPPKTNGMLLLLLLLLLLLHLSHLHPFKLRLYIFSSSSSALLDLCCIIISTWGI